MDEFEEPENQSVVSTLVPYVIAISSLVGGAILGAVLTLIIRPATEIEVPVPRDLTEAELQAACAPAIADKARDLESAHEKVRDLSASVATKEAKVAELEQEMSRRAERGRALIMELEQAKKDLEDAQEALVVAEEEKSRLVEELTITTAKLEETEEALEEQIVKTGRAQEDALTNKWYRFINDSQLEICERGNRKKLGKCREAIVGNLQVDEVRDAFAHCVRSNQAVPTVREIEKDAELPQFAQWINQDDRITRDWYVHMCDPTLPEADDGFWNEERLPGTEDDVMPSGGLDEDAFAPSGDDDEEDRFEEWTDDDFDDLPDGD